MTLYLKSTGEPFESTKALGKYLYAYIPETGNYHPVYLESWPKLKVAPAANTLGNANRDQKRGGWKKVALPKHVTIDDSILH